MTDLTPEEFRRACEMAGLGRRILGDVDFWLNAEGWRWHMADPALLAYVAERLVGRVWEHSGLDYQVDCGHPDVCLIQFSNQPTADGTTVSVRGKRNEWVELTIRAALEVLS